MEMSSGFINPFFDLCRMPKLVVSNVRAVRSRYVVQGGFIQMHASEGLH